MAHTPYPPQRAGMSTGAKLGLGCLSVVAVGLLGVGCIAVVSSGGDDEPVEAADEAVEDSGENDAEDENTDEEPTEDEGTVVGNGVHLVGDDIPAGTYRTEGPNEDDILPMCYWARLSGTGGELEEIIANDNLEGPGVVTVDESDVALELSGECDWALEE